MIRYNGLIYVNLAGGYQMVFQNWDHALILVKDNMPNGTGTVDPPSASSLRLDEPLEPGKGVYLRDPESGQRWDSASQRREGDGDVIISIVINADDPFTYDDLAYQPDTV